MRRGALGIVMILAVFGMMGCMDEVPMICMEIEELPDLPTICDFMGQECNMAMPPPTVCELLGIPPGECEDFFGGPWDLGVGTCQALQEAGGPCEEDDDCVNTCDVDVCT